MMSSQTVTLFTQQAELGPRPLSFAASFLFHCVAAAVLLFALAYKPPVANVLTERYSVRELDLHVPDEVMRAVQSRMPRPTAHPGARSMASAGNASPSPAAPLPKIQAPPGPQTLVQPDVLKPITLPEPIPLPQVVIWSGSKIRVRKIVPPQPQKPATANVQPSTERPNEEMNLADVNISSTFHPSAKSVAPPSATSAVAIPLPQQVQLPPVTASQPAAQPTPAAVVSLSDLRMKNGSVALPPVNESVPSNSQAALTPNTIHALALSSTSIPSAGPGQGTGQSSAGKANTPASGISQGSANKANHPGSGSDQASNGNAGNGRPGAGQGAEGKPGGSAPAAAAGTPNSAAPAPGSESGPDEGRQLTSTQITLPRDGHFGAVVVGDSLQDQFPELTEVWNGRLAYTVYLHVGLARNWIMQYALPRSTDASTAGAVIRLDAPWPYSIVRPNLAPDSIDADAIMIHGFINQTGRFELLTMIGPQGFPQAQFVLAALEKWQFRPALQDGHSTRVEVLIIIPAEFD